MLKTELLSPLGIETKLDICWHNLLMADKFHNIKYFTISVISWFKLNRNKNYQDLEKELRRRDFNTLLIAKDFVQNDRFGLELNCHYDYIYIYECVRSEEHT